MIKKVFLPFGRSIPLLLTRLLAFQLEPPIIRLKQLAAFPNLAGISPTRRKRKKDKRSDLTKKTSTG